MKVLTLISGGDVGGAKTHVLTLLRSLAHHIDVRMVCFTEAEFTSEAQAMGISTAVMDGGFLSVIRRLKKYIADEKFDIIHSHGSKGNFISTLLGFPDIPRIATVHSDWRLDYLGRPMAAITYGVLNAFSLRKMDYLAAVSDPMADLLISRGFKPDRIFPIYNGVDMTLPVDIVPRADFLKSKNVSFPADSIIVGIAARLNPVKDMATLLRGFAAAHGQEPRLRLLIAGDGPEEARLRELASALGVTDQVAFLGWLDDTASFYSALDINALTSLSETFPYALTEGARCSLATVSTRVGGVPKLIDNGVSGILIEPGDWEALSAALLRLAKNPALRADMGRRIHDKTQRLFSLDATCATMLDIYGHVLRRHAKRRDRRWGVAICGAYGRGNSGDEAIAEAIVAEIRETDPDIPICVMSVNPKETRLSRRVRAVHTFNIVTFSRISRRIGLYINGGGSLIQDVTSRRSLWFYLYTIWLAKKRGASVVMYGCGIGPVLYPSDRKLAARIINANVDVITLREDGSAAELADMGVTKPDVRLAADPSLLLEAAPADTVDSLMLTNDMKPGGRYICFVLRKWQGFEESIPAFAAAACHAYEKHGLTPVFLPINHLEDVEPARAVAARMACPSIVLSGPFRSGEVVGLMGRMSVVVSMRLHGLIFAAGHGTPLVGVVYDPKVSAFLRYIGQELFAELGSVTPELLTQLVDKAVARGSSDEQSQAVARLWELEKVNRRVLREFLSPGGPDN